MKRTLIKPDISAFPEKIIPYIENADIYDSSCSPMAKVFFVNKEQGFFVKTAAKGTLHREAEMTDFFHKKGLSAEVVGYFSEESDWFVTKKVVGDDCITQKYLDNPEKLCDSLAEIMHILHETDLNGCPCGDVMQALLMIAEQNHIMNNASIEMAYHKKYLNEQRIKDPEFTVSFDNLEALCEACHDAEHKRDSALRPGLCFDSEGMLRECASVDEDEAR